MASVNATSALITLNIIIFLTCVSLTANPCLPSGNPTKTSTSGRSIPLSWAYVVGTKPSSQCCELVKGLADFEATLCLCTAIKANVLGIAKVYKVPIALSLAVNLCGKKVPRGPLGFIFSMDIEGLFSTSLSDVGKVDSPTANLDGCGMMSTVEFIEDSSMTLIKANVLGIAKVYKVPIALSLAVNSCGKKVPR
ncbi:lipid-transfer protein, partial [Striga asiatica]